MVREARERERKTLKLVGNELSPLRFAAVRFFHLLTRVQLLHTFH
jgi:hypothetical protein